MAIFDWTTAHVSHLGAALLFFGLPGIVAIAGCVSLWMVWRGSEELREDVRHAFRILGRNLVTGLLAAATLVAGVIVLFESVHVLTD
jgi:hypothetical protein